MSVTSEIIRKMFKEGDDKRDAGLTTPEDIIRYDDIAYGTDEKWQKLDVYRPKKSEGKLPVIMSVHGGGWVYGDKERYQYYCMSLAQQGFAVVNFTYRLAPKFKFPASLEDTNFVAEWIVQNAQKYGFDTKHIFAVGDSAGAHILSLYTAILVDFSYASEYLFKVADGFELSGIALNCGAYQIEMDHSEDTTTKEIMKEFLPEKGTKQELEKINVLHHVTGQFPPVFLMTATGDFLKAQAELMSKKLLENNVPFEFHYYVSENARQNRRQGKKENELGHVFHCNMKLHEADRCNREECDFFRKLCS